MAEKDFYNIKGLGELPSENEAEHPAPPYQPVRPYKTKKPKKPKNGRSLLIVLAFVVVLAIAGGGGYVLANHHKSTKKTTTTTTTASSSTTTKPVTTTTTTNTDTTQYVSNGSDLNLSFSYPSGWTVTPASGGNSNDQTITLTSPLTTIPEAGGSSVTGRVVATIRPGSASMSELGANTPTAAVASTQIAYSAPTANQYQYPYLTFIHFSTGAKTAGAFEEVMVTGTTAFTAGQAVTTIALTGLDPIISATFSQCANTTCSATSATPLSITSDTWQNTGVFEQTQAIFTSLKLN
jgi:hypothetical protein